MKIKEQTRKLAIDSSKSCFEVVYKTAGVAQSPALRLRIRLPESAQSPALRLQIRLTKSVTDT